MTDMPDLLPCPFCGSGRVGLSIGYSLEYSVSCHNCHCEGATSAIDKDAMTAWNTRATPPSQAEQAVPAGWKMVPIEPTEEMIEAGYEHTADPCWRENYIEAYKASVAAAPPAPVPGPRTADTPASRSRSEAETVIGKLKNDDNYNCEGEIT